MSSKVFWRLLTIGILIAVTVSGLALLFVNRYTQTNALRHRDDFIMMWAQSIGRDLQIYKTRDVPHHSEIITNNLRPPIPQMLGGPPRRDGAPDNMMPPPPPPPFPPLGGQPDMPPPLELHGPPPFDKPPREFRPQPPEIWILSESGEVLLSTKESHFDIAWRSHDKPTRIDELKVKEDFFKLFAPTFTVKLATQDGFVFLVMKDKLKPFFGFLLLTQALLTFSTIVISLALAMALTFLYLRRQSKEASQVLLRLEQGDLKARFPIKKFDEFGGLLLDFNRAADEIEKLVNRIYLVESTRKHLLQELGHDFRTPLTTIRTTVETLKSFSEKMTVSDKNSMYSMLEDEITYMSELFEKLMTIASLDEPHYKKTNETIDLKKLIEEELENRRSASGQIKWEMKASGSPITPSGDSHLILRMIRNALDNASRYARTTVQVDLQRNEAQVIIKIQDDGPGFDEKSLKTFGERREFKARELRQNSHYSLGLGSVIIKAIAELHGGSVQAENALNPSGGVITLRLPSGLPQT